MRSSTSPNVRASNSSTRRPAASRAEANSRTWTALSPRPPRRARRTRCRRGRPDLRGRRARARGGRTRLRDRRAPRWTEPATRECSPWPGRYPPGRASAGQAELEQLHLVSEAFGEGLEAVDGVVDL